MAEVYGRETYKGCTIPIGYADGISRGWGNGVGFVTIKDKKANF
jgi:alanine racemase